MSKGPTQATSTQTVQIPQYIQDAQKNAANLAQSLTGTFTAQDPQFAVAGFNPDQTQAFDAARQMYLNTVNNPAPTGQASFNAAGAPTQAQAAQLSPDEINQFVNPYEQAALDPALANLRNQYGQNVANFNAKMAAGGAYGGSRQAVGDAQLAKDFDNQVAQTAGSMLNSGWNSAAGLAQGNAQMRNQVALANAAAANQTNLQNASMANQMALANAGNQMTAANQDFSRRQAALQQLLGIGNQQQQLQQQATDVPFSMLQRLVQSTPGFNSIPTSTTSTQPLQDNTLSSLLGVGLMGAKLFGLSDENTKTNVEEIGKDPATGLKIVAYDDKSDVARARKTGAPMPPKRVSVIAQDVEKKNPDAVATVAGRKVVNMPLLAQMMGVNG